MLLNNETVYMLAEYALRLAGVWTDCIAPSDMSDGRMHAIRTLAEGADIIMVKPAVPYLDVVTRLSERLLAPLAVYHVSGEYATIELLAREGLIDRRAGHLELWTSFKRAGASIVISYAAREARGWIQGL